ncbi:MAG: efflux RND transporter periplasmic adaptor subunit [bacterium]
MKKIKKNLKKIILIGVGLVVVGAVGFFVVRSKVAPLEVETTTVEKRSIRQTLTASGEVEASSSAKLSFGAYGTVTWVGVKEGDTVKKYQSLASVDKKTLQESLLSAQIAYQTAVTNFDKALETEGGVLATYRDTQETDYIRSQKAQYKQAVDVARQAVESAHSTRRVAEKNLSESNLVSPINGTVIAVNIKEGEKYLATSGPAITIANLGGFKFKVEVDESEIGKVILDQEAEVNLNAYDNEIFKAKVSKIAPAATLDSSGNKIFEAELELIDNQALLKVGLEGDAEIITSQKETLSVPWEAVVLEGDKAYVFKVIAGKAQKQEVKTGIQSADYYEIVSGLNNGDTIINNPPDSLSNGIKIKKNPNN